MLEPADWSAPVSRCVRRCQPTGSHRRPFAQFWQAIEKAKFTPPPDADLPALVRELTAMLARRRIRSCATGSPTRRSPRGSTSRSAWTRPRSDRSPPRSPPTCAWRVGSVGSDAVFRRSFSALMLSVVVARDNGDPVLSESSYRGLLDAALAYLAAERTCGDTTTRRVDPQCRAHRRPAGSSLAAAGICSRPMRPHSRWDRAQALRVSDSRLRRGRAVRTRRVGHRQPDGLRSSGVRSLGGSIEARSGPRRGPTAGQLQAAQNVKNFFSKFDVLLSVDPPPSDAVRAARDSVRAALRTRSSAVASHRALLFRVEHRFLVPARSTAPGRKNASQIRR